MYLQQLANICLLWNGIGEILSIPLTFENGQCQDWFRMAVI